MLSASRRNGSKLAKLTIEMNEVEGGKKELEDRVSVMLLTSNVCSANVTGTMSPCKLLCF